MNSLAVANELNKIASEIETPMQKKAQLVQTGEKVVCINPIQGIYKGRQYIADQYLEPGVLIVTELDGTPVGAFNAGRFCKDQNEF